MYNSQIQRLQSFHRPRAQAVEACAVFRRVVQASAPAYLRPLRGRSHDVMSEYGTFRKWHLTSFKSAFGSKADSARHRNRNPILKMFEGRSPATNFAAYSAASLWLSQSYAS
jgi:hypothetical protein